MITDFHNNRTYVSSVDAWRDGAQDCGARHQHTARHHEAHRGASGVLAASGTDVPTQLKTAFGPHTHFLCLYKPTDCDFVERFSRASAAEILKIHEHDGWFHAESVGREVSPREAVSVCC